MSQILVLFSIVLTSLSFASNSSFEESPAQKKALEIADKFTQGTLPNLQESPRYFTGPCIVLSANLPETAKYFALAGIQRFGDTVLTSWTVSYFAESNPFEGSVETLAKLYPNRKIAKVYFPSYLTEISQDPRVFYSFASDKSDSKTLYVLGSHVGLTYCELSEI